MTAIRTTASTSARRGFSRAFEQRSGIGIAIFFYVLVTMALSSVWRVAADSSGGEIGGYSAAALVWYIATAEACIVPIPIRLIYTTGEDITSGRIQSEMLRPMPPIIVRLAREFGGVLPGLGACAVAGIVFALLIAGAPADASALALAAPAAVLAVSANLAAQHAFAGASFWVRDASSAWFLYQKLVFLVGGMLIPLELLPDAVNGVLRYLPFAAMAYAPARLASGHFEPELLLIQLVWVVLLVALAARVFAAGERKIIRVGS